MHSLFSLNNPITNFIGKLFKLIWLNIIWLIFSLPIVTLGASTTALYYCSLRLARDEETYLLKDFLHSFKENFAQSTIMALIIAFVVLICGIDFYYFGSSSSMFLRIIAFLILGFLLVFAFSCIYIFPLIAQFKNRLSELFKSAFFISIRNIHWSFCLLILAICLPLVILFKFLPLIVLGFPLVTFLQAFIYNKIFASLLPNQNFTPGTLASYPIHLK